MRVVATGAIRFEVTPYPRSAFAQLNVSPTIPAFAAA